MVTGDQPLDQPPHWRTGFSHRVFLPILRAPFVLRATDLAAQVSSWHHRGGGVELQVARRL